jgi:endonuclease YncB( thermonuclease family)
VKPVTHTKIVQSHSLFTTAILILSISLVGLALVAFTSSTETEMVLLAKSEVVADDASCIKSSSFQRGCGEQTYSISDRVTDVVGLTPHFSDRVIVQPPDPRQEMNNHEYRLAGIDVPDLITSKFGSGDKPKFQCFAKESRKYLAKLLPAGEEIEIKQAFQLDSVAYAYVYRKRDGLFINAEMAKNGFALPMPLDIHENHNIHHKDFLSLAGEAKVKKKGLHGACL